MNGYEVVPTDYKDKYYIPEENIYIYVSFFSDGSVKDLSLSTRK